MVMTTPSGTGLDGVASLDSKKDVAEAIFGGADGDNVITVKGFESTKDFKDQVQVEVKATPWYGVDTAVQKPTTLFTGIFKISNGQIDIPISDMHKSWGYEVVIKPTNKKIIGASEVKYSKTPNKFVLRKEAEDATINHARSFSGSYASGANYVGWIDYSDSYVEFNVNVPSSGEYTMEIGYANGTSGDSTDQLLINGKNAQTVTFPATGGWTNMEWVNGVPNPGTRKTINVGVKLLDGDNTIRLQKSTSYAELDYIQLTD
jgi:Carbohydrate binding module (family 35)